MSREVKVLSAWGLCSTLDAILPLATGGSLSLPGGAPPRGWAAFTFYFLAVDREFLQRRLTRLSFPSSFFLRLLRRDRHGKLNTDQQR